MAIDLQDLIRARQPYRTDQLLTTLASHGFVWRQKASHIKYHHPDFTDIGNGIVRNSTNITYSQKVGKDCSRLLRRQADLAADAAGVGVQADGDKPPGNAAKPFSIKAVDMVSGMPLKDVFSELKRDLNDTFGLVLTEREGKPSILETKSGMAVEFAAAAGSTQDDIDRLRRSIGWFSAFRKLVARGYDCRINLERQVIDVKHAIHRIKTAIDLTDVKSDRFEDIVRQLLDDVESVDRCIISTTDLLQKTKSKSFSIAARPGAFEVTYEMPGITPQTTVIRCTANGRISSRGFLAVCDWYIFRTQKIFANSTMLQQLGIIQNRLSPQASTFESFCNPVEKFTLVMPSAVAARRMGEFAADAETETLIDPAFRRNLDQAILDAATFNDQLSAIMAGLMADMGSYRNKVSDLYQRMHRAGFIFERKPITVGNAGTIKIEHPASTPFHAACAAS